ncbi:MAG TPA: tyrosine-type recombinase/integrase [Candidatus Thermoplasmatota archaeon]
MEERTPPKPSRPKFGAWTAPPKAEVPKEFWDRSAFAGLNAEDQAERLVAFLKEHNERLRPITLRNKKIVLRRILRSFAERGKDLSTLTTEDCAAYREYLRDLAAKGVYALDTAAYSVRNWNATMRAVFGEKGKPGEGLLLKTFGQKARRVEHLTEAEMTRLIDAADRFPFRWNHTRLAFKTYLEVEWATGARFGSLFEGRLLVKDIDWERQVLVFRHMKNKDHHTAVLTPRAAVALKKWCDHLATQANYKGDETPVFAGPDGTPLSVQWLNKSLQGVAGIAGITKKVSTHMLRKSVGTLIGRENPKFAQLQLGISQDVYNLHYNQPLLEDRMAKRDILPGSKWKPTTPEEVAGAALLDLMSGKTSRDEFEAKVAKARQMKSQPEIFRREDVGYQ